jgi:hypothetical protein
VAAVHSCVGHAEDLAELVVLGDAGTDLGTAGAAADFDGDGSVDLAVSAPGFDRGGSSSANAGLVGIWFGPLEGGSLDLSTAPAVLTGTGATHRAGTALSAMELTTDALPELLIGIPGESSRAENNGAVAVVAGSGR